MQPRKAPCERGHLAAHPLPEHHADGRLGADDLHVEAGAALDAVAPGELLGEDRLRRAVEGVDRLAHVRERVVVKLQERACADPPVRVGHLRAQQQRGALDRPRRDHDPRRVHEHPAPRRPHAALVERERLDAGDAVAEHGQALRAHARDQHGALVESGRDARHVHALLGADRAAQPAVAVPGQRRTLRLIGPWVQPSRSAPWASSSLLRLWSVHGADVQRLFDQREPGIEVLPARGRRSRDGSASGAASARGCGSCSSSSRRRAARPCAPARRRSRRRAWGSRRPRGTGARTPSASRIGTSLRDGAAPPPRASPRADPRSRGSRRRCRPRPGADDRDVRLEREVVVQRGADVDRGARSSRPLRGRPRSRPGARDSRSPPRRAAGRTSRARSASAGSRRAGAARPTRLRPEGRPARPRCAPAAPRATGVRCAAGRCGRAATRAAASVTRACRCSGADRCAR